MTKISTKKIRKIILSKLKKYGFAYEEARHICNNILEAELSGKKSHGIISLIFIKDAVVKKKINLKLEKPLVENFKHGHYLMDGRNKLGYYVMSKSIDKVLQSVDQYGHVTVILKNTAPSIGYIGSYARKIASNGYIFICMSTAGNSLVPHGSTEPLLGTNPICMVVPHKNKPIVLDMATSKIAWGKIFLANLLEKNVQKYTSIDKSGNMIETANEALLGGLLPFGGAKGSSLALQIQLIVGGLSGTIEDKSHWGVYYEIINPSLYLDSKTFQIAVNSFINKYKKLSIHPNFHKILYPGENSTRTMQRALKKGFINIEDIIYETICLL